MEKLLPKLRFPGFSGEWEEKKLSKLGNFVGGGTPSTSNEDYWKGDIPWISSSDIFENEIHNIRTSRFLTEDAIRESATKIIPKNSILLVSRVGVGKLAINKVEVCTSQDFSNFIVANDNSYFIGYNLISRKNILQNFSQGTSIKGFTSSDIKTLSIAIPSIPEQTKIATFLTEVDKKLTALKQKKILLEQYKKGVMQQIFSQQLRFKDDNGNDFPDWEEKKLGDFCTFFSGGTPTSTNQKFYNGIIPFIGSGNIYDSEVFNFISEEALKSSSAKIVEKGDLLYALYGANSGEVAISKMNGAINQAILCIRNKECIQYLYYVLLLNKENIVSTYLQGGQGNLSSQIIKKLSYKFPSLPEQTKIANFLSAIDEKINHCQGQIEKMQVWKKGLLQKLFV